jgi:putative DNA primase/helicase
VADTPEDTGDPGPDVPSPPDNVLALDPKKRKKRSPPPRRGDWRDGFRLTATHLVAATVGNVDLVLRNDPVYAGKLRRNAMSAQDEHDGKPLTDEGYTGIRIDMERRFDFAPNKEDVGSAIARVASEKSYHPVADYLRSLVWDRELRIGRFLAEVIRCPETPLYQSIIRRWFVSAVARPLRPGCKVDTMLILQGAQGARKSSLFRALSEPWFVDSSMSLDNKDTYAAMGLCWLVEWAELDVVTKASRERVKGFLSSPEDTYRAPYARTPIRVPRTQTIVGSTNADEFLGDATGSRRFWVLPVGPIDLDKARAWRDQLWAEAVEYFNLGEAWYLDEIEETARTEEARAWELSDAWGEKLLPWASEKLPFTSHEALADGLGIRTSEINRAAEMRVGDILRRAGYISERPGSGDRTRRWKRKA